MPAAAEEQRAVPATRHRRRLSRTFARSRWSEYRGLLRRALAEGYRVRSLEDWLSDPAPAADRPTIVLRHDVDQHPRAVRPMLRAERGLGLASTWYFRWRTADPTVIAEVRAAGGAVGLHYETLTRAVLADAALDARDPAVIDRCRDRLREEIAAFAARFGPIRSACPHGDSRVPGVSNQVLLRDQDHRSFGIEFDGNDAMRRHALGVWLTDRSSADGKWVEGTDPQAVLAAGISPILCLTHPNNFASGPGLWADRILAALLSTPAPGERARLPRTRSDAPAPVA